MITEKTLIIIKSKINLKTKKYIFWQFNLGITTMLYNIKY